ncbi:MAG: GntR family transcriptional regulator [Phocaeicola sp.]
MNIKIDQKSPTPLYAQIEEQIRLYIHKKELLHGEKLPNELEMAEELGVARSTIRQAMNNLVADGLLVRKKSLGTFVSSKTISSKARNWLSFSQEMAMSGVQTRNYALHVSWQKADEEVAHLFSIEVGTKVLRLERLRGSEENPFVNFISYFNPRIGMTGEEDFTTPLYEILEKHYQRIAKTSIEEIGAQLADEELAEKLETTPGAAILRRKRSVYDTQGEAIEWNIGLYRADSFVYTVESDRIF